MVKGVLGIHHVTAISSDPQKTLDFYAKILGLTTPALITSISATR
jgi:hypothetical protein